MEHQVPKKVICALVGWIACDEYSTNIYLAHRACHDATHWHMIIMIRFCSCISSNLQTHLEEWSASVNTQLTNHSRSKLEADQPSPFLLSLLLLPRTPQQLPVTRAKSGWYGWSEPRREVWGAKRFSWQEIKATIPSELMGIWRAANPWSLCLCVVLVEVVLFPLYTIIYYPNQHGVILGSAANHF